VERENRGAGRRGAPESSQARRPDKTQAPHLRGEGIRGIPPPVQGEQAKPQQERGDGQQLPNVWGYLERRAKLNDRYPDVVKGKVEPRPDKFYRELRKIRPLLDELNEHGTPRDKLILSLFSTISGGLISLSQKDVQQFRSKVEHMSEDEIAEEIASQERKLHPGLYSGIALFDLLKTKDQKS
jgi:hypothetical protein